MNNSIKRSFCVFLRFLQRDFYVSRTTLSRYVVNNVVILPILLVLSEGYITQITLFGNDFGLNTMRFIGSTLLPLLILTFSLATPFLYDLEYTRYIDYQIIVLEPRLILLARIVFNALFTFFLMAFFYPLSKLFLGSLFVTTTTSWPLLFIILLLASFTASSYHILAMCILSDSSKFIRLWTRVSSPLFLLGGFSVPWIVMYEVSPLLAYCMLLNPFMYISEGIRQSILGSAMFFPIYVCIGMLCMYTLLFYCIALKILKKRLDHI